ncbi:uncharacterized protein [Chelonus insularis]|uniref:uncharacterized protein n=1 Tax=Chelonus insularis TaxID=460826 RepID=UPI00158EE470|nr:uncharacterized protein LOC118067846 [Chelonus insularis]
MFKNDFTIVLLLTTINFFWASTLDIEKNQDINKYQHQNDVVKKNSSLVKQSSVTNGHHDSPQQQHLLVNTIDGQEKGLTIIGLDHDKLGHPGKMTREEFEKVSLHYLRMIEPDDITKEWRTKRKRMRKKKVLKKKKKKMIRNRQLIK